jgi:hypothetical protein
MITYEPNLPNKESQNFDFQLTSVLRDIGNRLGVLAAGHIVGVRGKGTAAPTTGTWARGDVIRNLEPSESGSASSKYVVTGWICTVSGTPGTWLQMRTLTGN